MELWIVGKLVGKTWEFQGVFDLECEAVNFCFDVGDDNWFIGPVNLNEQLKVETEDWPNSYYPTLKGKDE